jgi:hypothetical protein
MSNTIPNPGSTASGPAAAGLSPAPASGEPVAATNLCIGCDTTAAGYFCARCAEIESFIVGLGAIWADEKSSRGASLNLPEACADVGSGRYDPLNWEVKGATSQSDPRDSITDPPLSLAATATAGVVGHPAPAAAFSFDEGAR